MSTKAKVKISQSKKGGNRPAAKLPYATQRLLKVLWQIKGGPRQLERLTGIPAQKFIHWRNEGRVSYKCLGEVSRKLGIVLNALDFHGINSLQINAPITWQHLMKSMGDELTTSQLEYINKGKIS